MDESIYRVGHLIGVLLTIMALSGYCVFMSVSEDKKGAWRRTLAAAHGVGMVLILVGGFGLLAKMKIDWPWPSFVWMKIVAWLILGAVVAPISRAPKLAFLWWWLILAVSGFAVYVAKTHSGV